MTSVLASLSTDQKLMMMETAPDITVDTEGVRTMMGFSVAFTGLSEGFYLPFNHAKGNLSNTEKSHVWRILSTRDSLIFHNAVHDIRVLARNGFDYRGKFYDTMLMAHWINEERQDYSLDAISRVYGGKPKSMPDSMKALLESDGWDNVPVSLMDQYSSNDAWITHELWRKLLPEFIAQGFDGELWATEQDFIRDVMGPMIDRGIKIDVGYSIREYMRGVGIMDACVKELGFKPSSRNALKAFLIDEMGLPVVKHTKSCKKCNPEDRRLRREPVSNHDGPPAFDKDAMAEYDALLEHKADERAKTILTYRGWQKTTSSNYKPYMELVDENHVLHPGYKLHGTKTGRLSCADPNLQQIPKSSDKDWNGNLKTAFIARTGYDLWTVDYAQLQFRMTCGYAGQDDLIDIFNDASRDIFTEMASQMGWLRADVKTLVYLILFGGGATRASVAFGVSVEQGKELVEEFHARYPLIKKISKAAERAAMKQGYVTYWTGRRRHFPKGSAYFRSFNSVIQGGEAEIIKRAMIRIEKEICAPSNNECRLILQIHDEITFEIKTGKAEHYIPLIQKVMEEAGADFCKHVGATVAFRTSAGKWGEK